MGNLQVVSQVTKNIIIVLAGQLEYRLLGFFKLQFTDLQQCILRYARHRGNLSSQHENV